MSAETRCGAGWLVSADCHELARFSSSGIRRSLRRELIAVLCGRFSRALVDRKLNLPSSVSETSRRRPPLPKKHAGQSSPESAGKELVRRRSSDSGSKDAGERPRADQQAMRPSTLASHSGAQ